MTAVAIIIEAMAVAMPCVCEREMAVAMPCVRECEMAVAMPCVRVNMQWL